MFCDLKVEYGGMEHGKTARSRMLEHGRRPVKKLRGRYCEAEGMIVFAAGGPAARRAPGNRPATMWMNLGFNCGGGRKLASSGGLGRPLQRCLTTLRRVQATGQLPAHGINACFRQRLVDGCADVAGLVASSASGNINQLVVRITGDIRTAVVHAR